MLRSYDPQTCSDERRNQRFLQHDPYDQFASGYVGMGNDFGNIVDPTGGWGTGVGCAAVAGMSGYGGMAGRISGASNMVSVISTLATVSSMAMRGGGIVGSAIQQSGSITQSLQFGGGSESSRGHGPSADDGGGSAEEDASNGCKCPEGYGLKPKVGGDGRPYFKSINDAAIYWAWKHRGSGRDGVEWSSLLYSTNVGSETLYASTETVRYPDLPLWGTLFGAMDPKNSSPGLDHPDHEKLLLNGKKLDIFICIRMTLITQKEDLQRRTIGHLVRMI